MAQLYGNNKEVGKPSNWYPLACTKQVDGTYILKVDTELSVDSLTLEINNIQVGSTDNTKNNTTYLKTKADGTVYVEGSISVTKGNPVVYDGNANILKATVTFAASAKHIQVEDMDGINNIYISFDGGTKWRTIQPGYILDIDCDSVASIDIKAAGNNTPYEMLILE